MYHLHAPISLQNPREVRMTCEEVVVWLPTFQFLALSSFLVNERLDSQWGRKDRRLLQLKKGRPGSQPRTCLFVAITTGRLPPKRGFKASFNPSILPMPLIAKQYEQGFQTLAVDHESIRGSTMSMMAFNTETAEYGTLGARHGPRCADLRGSRRMVWRGPWPRYSFECTALAILILAVLPSYHLVAATNILAGPSGSPQEFGTVPSDVPCTEVLTGFIAWGWWGSFHCCNAVDDRKMATYSS